MAVPSSCRFRFGMQYLGPEAQAEPHDYSGIDYITVWIGQHDVGGADACGASPCFNRWWHGSALQLARARGLSVAYYSYIIAFMAKATGLYDCDVGTPSLCQRGAAYIRTNERAILRTYAHFANETSRWLGADAEMLWLMEPDWYQYSEHTQEGGGLSQAYMVELYNRLTAEVLRFLPGAKFSLDISPWVNDQRGWMEPFVRKCQVDFVHTSGGRTTGGSERIRRDAGNMVTWAQVHQASGRGIIADTGYGVGGVSMGHVASWDDEATLLARIADGVVAVTQAEPGYGWSQTLSELRPRLTMPSTCAWHTPQYEPRLAPPPPQDTAALSSAWRSSTPYLAAGALGLSLLYVLIVRVRDARPKPTTSASGVGYQVCINLTADMSIRTQVRRLVGGYLRRRAVRELARANATPGCEGCFTQGRRPRPSRRRSHHDADDIPSNPSLENLADELEIAEPNDLHRLSKPRAASPSRSAPGVLLKPWPRSKPRPQRADGGVNFVPFPTSRTRDEPSDDAASEDVERTLLSTRGRKPKGRSLAKESRTIDI